MSPLRIKSIGLPQVQLRTILLVFGCAAIGMTCATAPRDKSGTTFGINLPKLELHYALLYAAATAIAFGFIQQVLSLRELKIPPNAANREVRFAKYFAIAWRVGVVAGVAACTVSRILLSRKLISLPESNIGGVEIFPDTCATILVVVALFDSVNRWSAPSTTGKHSVWITAAAAVTSLVFALLVLPETNFLTFLIHVATQGIEFSHPAKFQRLGTFPDHQAEHFRFFWLSLATVVCISLAATALALANLTRSHRGRRIAYIAVYLGLLVACGAFCLWYYTHEFPRISPDMASVGLSANWLEMICRASVATLLITTIAYRISKLGIECDNCTSVERNTIPLHEMGFVPLLLLAAMIIYFVENIRALSTWYSNSLELISDFLRYTSSYLYVAVIVLSLQLLWLRWKWRNAGAKLGLQPIDPLRFSWNWLAVFLLTLVGIPTISIYCFAYWLGPWYLYGN